MSSHQIQFQHGKSIPEFLTQFANEAHAVRRGDLPGALDG